MKGITNKNRLKRKGTKRKKWIKTSQLKNKTKKQHGSASLDKSGKLKKVNCSPKDKSELNKFTCYTDKSLYKLRDLWNVRHEDKKITTNNTKEIHLF